jgi:hypothetical protein
MIDSFRAGGEPSDLNPYLTPGDFTTFDQTIAMASAQALLALVNRAATRVASWMYGDGTVLRFRRLLTQKLFQTKRESYSCSGGSLVTAVFPVSAIGEVSGCYDGFTVEVTAGAGLGQNTIVGSTVVAAGVVTLTFAEPLSVTIGATSVIELARNWISFVDPAAPLLYRNDIPISEMSIADIIRVRELSMKADLQPKERTERFTGSIGLEANPTQYWHESGRLFFDSVVPKDLWFELLYMRNPTPLVLYSDVLEIPLQYHDAIPMWVGHKLLMDQQDFNGAYALKRELEDFMNGVRPEGALQNSAEELSLVVWG